MGTILAKKHQAMKNDNARKRVLIVDDSRDSRWMLKAIAESAGLQTVEADNGLKALELARTQKPALILMDLSMPLMDGLEATRRLKRDQQLSHIPVVAVTGVWKAEDALRAGCTDYLAKPIEIEAVTEMLRLLTSDSLRTKNRPPSTN